MSELSDRILAAALEIGPNETGEGYETHLNFGDLPERDPALFGSIADRLALEVGEQDPDAVTYSKLSSRALATAVAERLDVKVIDIDEKVTSKGRQFTLAHGLYYVSLAATRSRIAMINTVTSDLGFSGQVMELPQLDGKFVGHHAVWRQGQPGQERSLPLPDGTLPTWLIEEPLPSVVTFREAESYWYRIRSITSYPRSAS